MLFPGIVLIGLCVFWQCSTNAHYTMPIRNAQKTLKWPWRSIWRHRKQILTSIVMAPVSSMARYSLMHHHMHLKISSILCQAHKYLFNSCATYGLDCLEYVAKHYLSWSGEMFNHSGVYWFFLATGSRTSRSKYRQDGEWACRSGSQA